MTMNRIDFSRPARQQGVALFIGLIFLVVLSLVAVIAMRGTLLEMRMATNVARHEQAFEASETLRAVPMSVFDEHVFNRGWPEELGGSLPNDDFAYTLKPDMVSAFSAGLQDACDGSKDLFYSGLQAACNGLPAESRYDPGTWHPDVVLTICDVGTADCGANITAAVAIVPDGTVLEEGSGSAQAAGYRGLGGGAASGGGAAYFEVMSTATVPGNGRAVTMSQFRQAIRN